MSLAIKNAVAMAMTGQGDFLQLPLTDGRTEMGGGGGDRRREGRSIVMMTENLWPTFTLTHLLMQGRIIAPLAIS